MDWEAPVDAWYVFLAVSIVSVAVAGVVLGLPTGPPPDSNQAANTIERVASSPTEASATWEYEADTVVIDGPTIEMENDHGTSHATADYDTVVVPVNDSERLEDIARGASFEEAYADELDDGDTHAVQTFLGELEAEYEKNSGEPMTASGEMVVRQVSVDPDGDSLDSLEEEVEIRSDSEDWGILVTFTGIGEVYASYDGIPGNGIEVTAEGETIGGRLSDPIYTHEEKEFTYGVGGAPLDTHGAHSRPATSPIDVTVEFDNGATCEKSLGHDSEKTCYNSVSRSAEFDDSAPFVEHKEETDRYHVTIVIV